MLTRYTGELYGSVWTGSTDSTADTVSVRCYAYDDSTAIVFLDGNAVDEVKKGESKDLPEWNVGYNRDFTVGANGSRTYCMVNAHDSSRMHGFIFDELNLYFMLIAYIIIFAAGLRKGLRRG